MKDLKIEENGVVVYLDTVHVDRRRDGKSALGWFALDRSPLAFLRDTERALFCDASLSHYLPEALPLSAVLTRISK